MTIVPREKMTNCSGIEQEMTTGFMRGNLSGRTIVLGQQETSYFQDSSSINTHESPSTLVLKVERRSKRK